MNKLSTLPVGYKPVKLEEIRTYCQGNNGYFVSMPSRKRPDGTHQDIAHPINSETRMMIEKKVLEAYELELKTRTESPT